MCSWRCHQHKAAQLCPCARSRSWVQTARAARSVLPASTAEQGHRHAGRAGPSPPQAREAAAARATLASHKKPGASAHPARQGHIRPSTARGHASCAQLAPSPTTRAAPRVFLARNTRCLKPGALSARALSATRQHKARAQSVLPASSSLVMARVCAQRVRVI